MKIILPIAGKGVRLRPYTNELPKCLLPVGGKTIIDWIVEDANRLTPKETIFIAGYKAEKIQEYLEKKPEWGNTRVVLQMNPQGLGEAIARGLPYVNDEEPLLIILGDTLFEADLAQLEFAEDNVLYTYKVSDPRRFGVAVTNEKVEITELVEKPQTYVSDEAIVGIYYIKDTAELRKALRKMISKDIRSNGEIQLTDALQMMIEAGCKFKTAPVERWLDCGLPETLIDTNSIMLNKNDNSANFHFPGTKIIPPCHIGKNVKLENCTIGPNVDLGDNCSLRFVNIKNCVVWANESLSFTLIENQIVASC